MTLPAVEAESWRLANGLILDLRKPHLMGVVNVTPDSFSDGNRFVAPQRAIEHALALVEAGADIIDIGGESTRPKADPVSADEELERILPVLEGLSGKSKIPISVDTSKAKVAKQALAAGAAIINDVTGLQGDSEMARVVAQGSAGVVIMHSRGTPQEMQRDTRYDDLISEVRHFLAGSMKLARQAGVSDEQMVIDPGIGFGKDVVGNLSLLRHLAEFRTLGRPILVGTSRKSFVGTVLGRNVDERLMGTAATVAVSLMQGARIFRVHDVREMRDIVDMTQAILVAP
ncbi:MAG TPA: dihydropteroate synthase [Geobacterales bacterium]|nr:dihydropteroate synthase [Geobacterales bacterium]